MRVGFIFWIAYVDWLNSVPRSYLVYAQLFVKNRILLLVFFCFMRKKQPLGDKIFLSVNIEICCLKDTVM